MPGEVWIRSREGPMKTPPFLVNAHYQDRYFDVVNAIAEARHVYFEGCQLLPHLQQNKSLSIGETGFGAGRVLLSLLCFLEELGPALKGAGPHQIAFASVELHPLSPERLSSILHMFTGQLPTIDTHIAQLVSAYAQLDLQAVSQWQHFTLESACGPVKVSLWFGEALEMVQAVSPRDAWFLEGHGPKTNPAMWRPELLQAVGEKTTVGGYCATFTVAGHLRRDLRAAGFNVRRLPGFGGKKEVLQGQKRPPHQQTFQPLNLSPYQEDWAVGFRTLKHHLYAQLPPGLVGIEHVGSTSIVHMLARAELDIALIASSHWQREALHQGLLHMGYQVHQEREQSYFQHASAPSETMPHRLFLLTLDNPELHQQLLLRDYLRRFPERSEAYSRLKQTLLARHPNDVKAYTGAKTRFLNQLVTEARERLK